MLISKRQGQGSPLLIIWTVVWAALPVAGEASNLPGQRNAGILLDEPIAEQAPTNQNVARPAPTPLTHVAAAPLPPNLRDTDWELYMLRLVNRARRDPAGEPARIGSAVTDTRSPVPPLAYDLLLANSATSHNTWMHDNLGAITSGHAPDSFTHYETLDGLSTGPAATDTPSYTGAMLGDRITAAGYQWNSVGENILTNYSTQDMPITQARIDSYHRAWWESSGHRNNMLSANYSSFGFQIESRAFTPPRGGLNAPIDNLLFTTQDFGRPLSIPRTYLLGLLYWDHDRNAAWTPRAVDDPLREGLMDVNFQVWLNGTTTVAASGTTLGNGAFSARVASGVYDVVFTDARLPGGQFRIEDVTIATANVDLGDFQINPPPDTTPPTVQFATPSAGALVAGLVTAEVTATDNVGIASVSLAVDGTVLGTDSGFPYLVTWDTAQASNGSHTLTATARDTNNLTTSTSITVTVNNVPLDTIAPIVSITNPANGATIMPRRSIVTITATASDNVGITRVEFYVDKHLTCTDTKTAYTCAWPVSATSVGRTYRLDAKAYDARGNVGFAAPVTVTVTTTRGNPSGGELPTNTR